LGDSIYSTNEWTVSSEDLTPSSCVVRVLLKNEYRGRVFKGAIEDYVTEAARQAMVVWFDMVHKRIESLSLEQMVQHKEPKILEYVEESEGSDTESELFYDSVDTLQTISQRSSTSPPPSTEASMQIISNLIQELNQVKSLVEVNNSRLLGLESAFAGMNHSPSKSNNTLSSVNNRYLGEGRISEVMQRLDAFSKKQQEEEENEKEKETVLKLKIEELERKVDKLSKLQIGLPTWQRVSLVVFFLVWPIVALKLWKKYAMYLPLLWKKIVEILHKP